MNLLPDASNTDARALLVRESVMNLRSRARKSRRCSDTVFQTLMDHLPESAPARKQGQTRYEGPSGLLGTMHETLITLETKAVYDPGTSNETLTQRKLELHLAEQWLARLPSLLSPQAFPIPNLWKFMGGENAKREWRDIFGDKRFGTLRIHTRTLSSVVK